METFRRFSRSIGQPWAGSATGTKQYTHPDLPLRVRTKELKKLVFRFVFVLVANKNLNIVQFVVVVRKPAPPKRRRTTLPSCILNIENT